MRFVADGMLGKLTRWLRMLGHDVKYSSELGDKKLIEIAEAESRILLTRDLELYQQATVQGVESFLVEEKPEAEKLAALAKRFNFKLEIDIALSRCPKCNARIRPIAKEEVLDKIPKKTASNYEDFWECDSCNQVYWQGSHWKRIDKTLKEAQQMLERR
ncbi:MAG: Mut7-C RNAse domain-containing protein [Candidatus Bathyarchaeia archaeon]